MNRTLIRTLPEAVGKDVKVQGWVHSVRDQKVVKFLILRDHTGLAQCVIDASRDPSLAGEVSKVPVESALTVHGRVVGNSAVKLGGLEIQASEIGIDGRSDSPTPIDPHARVQPDLEKRMNWRFLDLRNPRNLLIFKVQTTAEMAMREHWVSSGFVEIHSPKLMGTASESGAELFSLEYFGKTAYLAQSPQFYKQMAISAGFDRVFEIGPVYRANPSFTSRHDTEFTSVDVEISWIDSHEDVMTFEEQWLQYVISRIKDKHGDEILKTFGKEVRVPSVPFPRLTMKEALNILKKQKYRPAIEGAEDLDPEGERLIAAHTKRTHNHDFTFVKDYPITVRPFYHMRYSDEPAVTKSFDLLFKGLEITTGAQREHRHEILIQQALEKGLGLQGLQFYLDFFKYGCPPHGGFGFGLTRLLMVLLGLKNVREVTYIYRGPNRLYP
jgi:nondiscriminating aspartyl-tRNA synthetase